MLDFFANLLKYVGLILTPTMAIIAFTQKTKDAKTGRLNRVGRRYVTIIIVCAVVTLASAAVENARQARSTAEQLKRNKFLLEQVIRGQYPLQNVKASYQFDVPATWPGIARYEAELDARMPTIASNAASREFRQTNDIWLIQLPPTEAIMFCEHSPFMPSAKTNPEAAQLVGALNVRILLYRRPVDPAEWPLFVPTGKTAVQPDLEMWFASGNRCIDYRSSRRRMILRDIGALTNPEQWQNSGEIISLMDFRGAQMVVDSHPRRTDDAPRQLQLSDFELFVGSLQALWLPRRMWTVRTLPNGDHVYEFVFPSALDEILALQRRERRVTRPTE